jgi:NAD(P)H dehydrogenase (quinone)
VGVVRLKLASIKLMIVGLPYILAGQSKLDEITGGSPYGASTIVGTRGPRWPSENELDAARFQGRHIAALASRITPLTE